MDADAIRNMTLRQEALDDMNNQAKMVIDFAKSTANRLKGKKNCEAEDIEHLNQIIEYWTERIKANNYEKLMINIIKSQNVNNILKVAPNLRQKYLDTQGQVCELHSNLVACGKIVGFDEFSYMTTCKSIQKDVKQFTGLCDLIINHLDENA